MVFMMAYPFSAVALAASFLFLSCSSDNKGSDNDPCKIEYNPKTQFCSDGIVKNKNEFTDARDNKIYRYVEIGGQSWMAENLNYETPYSKCHDDNPDKCSEYGRLYDWSEAMGIDREYVVKDNSGFWIILGASNSGNSQGICPDGWRLPNDNEWQELVDFIGGDEAGKKLKSKTNNGTDELGFSALPGGYAVSNPTSGSIEFGSIGAWGNWWSATSLDPRDAKYWAILNESSGVYSGKAGKIYNLYSVRCIKNDNS